MRCVEKLLLVDDQEADLAMLRRSFSRAAPEIKITSCQGSADAVERIAGGEADVVLLDIAMPGLNGFEVLEQAKRLKHGCIPVTIMLTSSEDPTDIRQAYGSGAAAYLIKPATLDGYHNLAKSIAEFWGKSAVCPLGRAAPLRTPGTLPV